MKDLICRPAGAVLFGVSAAALALTSLVTAQPGVAAHLEVDGGVAQVFTLDAPPPEPAGPLAACGDLSAYDGVIEGTENDEILIGTHGRDILIGHGGDDVLLGGLGDDCLVGGAGNDLLYGHKGRDVLLGGPGHDLLFGGWGEDLLDGGPGHNVCHGGLEIANCVLDLAPDGDRTQTLDETDRELDQPRTPRPADSAETPSQTPVAGALAQPEQPEAPAASAHPTDHPKQAAGSTSDELGAASPTGAVLTDSDTNSDASAD